MKTKKQIDSLAKKGLESLPDSFRSVVWKADTWKVMWQSVGHEGNGVDIEYHEDLGGIDCQFRAFYSDGSFGVAASGKSTREALDKVIVAVFEELRKKSREIQEVGSFFKELERQCKLKLVTAKCRLKSARRRTN